jgi:hypothetical protein
MLKKILLAFAVLVASVMLLAPKVGTQTSVTGRVGVGPTASLPTSCHDGDQFNASDTGVIYLCTTGSWVAQFGRGAGTGAVNLWSLSWFFKGPVPYVDASAYGARAFQGGDVPAGYWATCNGTNKLQISTTNGGFTFIPGDGITVYGCGATNALSTPSAPTVTPSTAAGETGTGWATNIPSDMAGRSTYSYKIVAEDNDGGLTVPSSATATSTGQSSLGLTTNNISTITRSNDTITIVTTAPNLVGTGTPAGSGSLVHIVAGTGANAMNGWYIVGTRTDSTTFSVLDTPVDTRAQGWAGSDTYEQTRGTIAYYVSNHITITYDAGAWIYYVCAERPGDSSYKLIGATHPQGLFNGYQDLNFDDYGATMMNGQTFPAYVSDTSGTPGSPVNVCNYGTATNDMLTTTVLSMVTSGGHETLTLAKAASQSASGQFAVVDAAPGLLAAANASNASHNSATAISYVLIPGQTNPPAAKGAGVVYKIFSPLVIPAGTAVVDQGLIETFEPIILKGNSTWTGKLATNFGGPQFGWNSGAEIMEMNNQPAMYITSSGNLIDHTYFTALTGNGGDLTVLDSACSTVFDHVSWNGGGGASTDFLSQDLIWRDTSSTVCPISLYTVGVDGGPNQVVDASWTPLIYFAPGQNGSGGNGLSEPFINIDHYYGGRRGLYISNYNFSDNPGSVNINFMYRQGGITPLIAIQDEPFTTHLSLHEMWLDTESNPILANLNAAGFGGSVDLSVQGGGINAPLFTGVRNSSVRIYQFTAACSTTQYALPNRGGTFQGPANSVLYPFDTTGSYIPSCYNDELTLFEPAHIPGGQSIYWDLPAPTSVTAGSPSSGGAVPVATSIYYFVSAVGADGGETIPSLPSAVVRTSSGEQTVRLTWTNAVGTISNNVYRCVGSASTCLQQGIVKPNGGWFRLALHVTGTSYSDSEATGTNVGNMVGVTGTGSTVINNSGVYSPLGQTFPQPFANLAACSTTTEGQFATVQDSTTNTWGATISGSGSDVVLAFCDGSNWTVYGK